MTSHWDLNLDSQSESDSDYSGDGEVSFSENSSISRDDVQVDYAAPPLEAVVANFVPVVSDA